MQQTKIARNASFIYNQALMNDKNNNTLIDPQEVLAR